MEFAKFINFWVINEKFSKKNKKKQAITGSTINFLGTTLRVVGILMQNPPYSTWTVFLGQSLCAFAQCFILGIPGALSEKFFPKNMINFSTSVASLANELGFFSKFFIIFSSLFGLFDYFFFEKQK